MSGCRFECLFVSANLSRLTSERHETRHVGPLGTRKCLRLIFIFQFQPRSLILAQSHFSRYYLSQCLRNQHASSQAHFFTLNDHFLTKPYIYLSSKPNGAFICAVMRIKLLTSIGLSCSTKGPRCPPNQYLYKLKILKTFEIWIP